MTEVKVYDKEGNVRESRPLNGPLFNSEPKPHLLHSYVKAFLNNQRQGTSSTKTRTGVSGGGAKPWRQKGTGRARAGSNTSPIWVGGGIVWGPHPKNWSASIPRKLKRQALVSAFSDKVAGDNLRLIEIPELDRPKTKVVQELLKRHELLQKKVLLLDEGRNENLAKSCRNLKWLIYKRSMLVNPYDILWADCVLMTQAALEKIEEVFNN